MQRNRGYTLLELSIGVAIVAVLLNLALSGYSNASQAAAALEARNALLATLTVARNKAALLEVDVGLCPSRDGRNCERTHHWEHGWLAYADLDRSDAFDPADQVLVRQEGLRDGVRLVTSSGRYHLEFQPNGSNAGSNATFTLCDRRGAAKASAIAMSNMGNYRAVEPAVKATLEACGTD